MAKGCAPAAPAPEPFLPALAAVALFVAALSAGCASRPHFVPSSGDVAPSASTFWKPPEVSREAPVPQPKVDIPENLRERPWGLADVLDLALRNSPATRAAWLDAQAAAARYGSERGSFLPEVSLDASASVRESNDSGPDASSSTSSYGPAVGLSWLLLDFGTRSGSLEAARQALLAANWTQNRVLQDTVLQVQRAYYNYMASKAIVTARRVSLKDAELNREAAEKRHEAGVATIADVLQARTAVARAKLEAQTAAGTIEITRGALAASMGLPANLPFDIEDLPKDLPVGGLAEKVDALIGQSLDQRPDLAAARAQVLEADAQVHRVKGEGLPVLSLNGVAGRTWSDGDSGSGGFQDAYSAGLLLRYPLFTGFTQSNNERKAEAEAGAARQRALSLEQQVVLQVYTAYFALQTATEKVSTAKELLASAEQNEAVAVGRYREGVGTFLDVVAAQTALSDARTERVRAYWEWYTALAQLAHDTGLLGLGGETPLDPRGK